MTVGCVFSPDIESVKKAPNGGDIRYFLRRDLDIHQIMSTEGTPISIGYCSSPFQSTNVAAWSTTPTDFVDSR
jgi:hypothetical protein